MFKELLIEKTVQKGDRIFTKNDREFYARVADIKGNKVKVEWTSEDGWEDFETMVPKSKFKKWNPETEYEEGYWTLPNWTLS